MGEKKNRCKTLTVIYQGNVSWQMGQVESLSCAHLKMQRAWNWWEQDSLRISAPSSNCCWQILQVGCSSLCWSWRWGLWMLPGSGWFRSTSGGVYSIGTSGSWCLWRSWSSVMFDDCVLYLWMMRLWHLRWNRFSVSLSRSGDLDLLLWGIGEYCPAITINKIITIKRQIPNNVL